VAAEDESLLSALGLVWADGARHGAWRMSEAAIPVLKGERRVEMREETATAARRADRAGAPQALVDEADEPLLAALKACRRRLAEARKVPAYVIFPDRTLIDMAARKPATLDEMAGCHGVGVKKLEQFGRDFLAVLTGETVAPPHPARPEAGSEAAALFDALDEAQRELARGADGTGKPLTCARATLSKIVSRRPASHEALAAIPGMGPAKAERFGPVFLAIIADHGR
jgi:ATP-dependent DNA helicase RecQ